MLELGGAVAIPNFFNLLAILFSFEFSFLNVLIDLLGCSHFISIYRTSTLCFSPRYLPIQFFSSELF
jgi:hypothetical protein